MRHLDLIAVFVEVARRGSFTEAARILNMPLSTVSRKVAELEAALQIHLIDRSRKPLRITETGQAYLELCAKGIDALSYANQAIRGSRTAFRERCGSRFRQVSRNCCSSSQSGDLSGGIRTHAYAC